MLPNVVIKNHFPLKVPYLRQQDGQLLQQDNARPHIVCKQELTFVKITSRPSNGRLDPQTYHQ